MYTIADLILSSFVQSLKNPRPHPYLRLQMAGMWLALSHHESLSWFPYVTYFSSQFGPQYSIPRLTVSRDSGFYEWNRRFESFLPSPRNQQKNSCRRSQLLSFPSYPPFLSLQGLLDHFLLVLPPWSKSILVGFASKTWSLMPGEIFDTWSLFEVP
ncbi:unnamed protein product [Citrullus colocynthis]|uniref:Uncharacterized protein n=1 Tax=Citrullus colocynthis TaxID=252529 RepID=A0ABP0YMU3_9ROSI